MKRILLALLLVLMPMAAHAQDPEQRITAARQRAAASGIPVTLLDAKVNEGRAKRVPADRIAAAVERRLDGLVLARTAMAGGGRVALTASDLSVGADALDAGVAPEVLGRLAAGAPPQQRAVAIAKLTELVQAGEASERALERVSRALRQGPEELGSLRPQGGSRGRGPDGAGPPGQVGREPGARGRGNGQGGGPPSSVPGPGKKPERPGRGGGKKP